MVESVRTRGLHRRRRRHRSSAGERRRRESRGCGGRRERSSVAVGGLLLLCRLCRRRRLLLCCCRCRRRRHRQLFFLRGLGRLVLWSWGLSRARRAARLNFLFAWRRRRGAVKWGKERGCGREKEMVRMVFFVFRRRRRVDRRKRRRGDGLPRSLSLSLPLSLLLLADPSASSRGPKPGRDVLCHGAVLRAAFRGRKKERKRERAQGLLSLFSFFVHRLDWKMSFFVVGSSLFFPSPLLPPPPVPLLSLLKHAPPSPVPLRRGL